MAYIANYVPDYDYVSGKISGKLSQPDMEKFRNEIISLLHTNDCGNLLIEALRESPRRSIVDDFEFASQHAARFPPRTRHAIVVQPGEMDYMQFVKDVATNRGAAMNLFTSKEQALQWLLPK